MKKLLAAFLIAVSTITLFALPSLVAPASRVKHTVKLSANPARVKKTSKPGKFTALRPPPAAPLAPPNISFDVTSKTYVQGIPEYSWVAVNTGGPVSYAGYGYAILYAGLLDGTASNDNDYPFGLNSPINLAVDAAGNICIADQGDHRIRRIAATGAISNFAGSGVAGSADGTGEGATLRQPSGVAFDAAGNLFVADYGNHKIRKITTAGVVTTFAGNGTAGATDGNGTAATFNHPTSLVADAAGNIFVTDYGNQKIRKITAAGVVTTFAGSGTAGSANGTGAGASFNGPSGITINAAGNLYLADANNNLIRMITPAAVVTTFAGTGGAGAADGAAAGASFNSPRGVAIDALNIMYVADFNNNSIRKITGGVVSTLVAPNLYGMTGPTGVVVDKDSHLLVSQPSKNKVLSVSLDGYEINPKTFPGGIGFGSNVGDIEVESSVQLMPPTNYTVTAHNASGESSTTITIAVIAPPAAPKISYATPAPYLKGAAITPLAPASTGGAIPAEFSVVTTFAGSGASGAADGPTTTASFETPTSVVTDASGNLFVTDQLTGSIRKITPAGVTSTFAGGQVNASVDGTGAAAGFMQPTGITIDKTGNLYVTDFKAYNIRKITPEAVVTTIAGSGVPGVADGVGTTASFGALKGIAMDSQGNLFVCDAGSIIRKITPAGVVTTFAGQAFKYGKKNGLGTAATFDGPIQLAIDSHDNLYVSDLGNNLIRKITPAGLVSTYAGSGYNTPDANGFVGTDADLAQPYGMAVDSQDNIYVSDYYSKAGVGCRIQKITPDRQVTFIAGSNRGSKNDIAIKAMFSSPTGLALDAMGNIYVADQGNRKIRKISISAFTIVPGLPKGLNFDGATGTISGTPLEASPPTDYTIQVTNAGGTYKLRLTLSVGDPSAPPHISYAGSPATVTTGFTITPLAPTNSGGPVPTIGYGRVATLAGSGTAGTANGTGAAASFNQPIALAFDGAGNAYVADANNNVIRKVTLAGVVTTFAGSGTTGTTNGTGTGASFNHPTGIAADNVGNMFVADEGNNLIRKITPAGVVSTFAGTGTAGFNDGAGTAAMFNRPYGLAADDNGNVWVSDTYNNRVRKITPAGMVSTFAGSAAAGAVNGAGTAARFNHPIGIAVDVSGNIFVADRANNIIRKISSAGVVKTLAGSGAAGAVNGAAAVATFNQPFGLTVDAAGNLYVADENSQEIRKVSPTGIVTRFAGNGTAGSANGIATGAGFNNPAGVALAPNGALYITELQNHDIRTIGTVGYLLKSTLPAGLHFDVATGIISGKPTVATPARDIIIAAYNNGGSSTAVVNITVSNTPAAPAISYVGSPITLTKDATITSIRPTNTGGPIRATPYGEVTTFAGTGYEGNFQGEVYDYNVPETNGPRLSANLSYPIGMVFDSAGNMYFADSQHFDIRKISTAGMVTTIAGAYPNESFADGTGAAAKFESPYGIAIDGAGNLYVTDQANGALRKVTPAGEVTSFTGSGFAPVTNWQQIKHFLYIQNIAIDTAGTLYISENIGYIEKVAANGTVTVLAGSTTMSGSSNGTGADATFWSPDGIVVDPAGNLFVAERGNNLIRKITPAGVVTTFAGSGAQGSADGTGTAASFRQAAAITIDAQGNLYVADLANCLIRKITPDAKVTTIAGNKQVGNANGIGTAASFGLPAGVAIGNDGDLYVADTYNNLIRKVSLTGYTISPALPAGLTFNPATGIITGKPTVASPATNYTVTAYNAGGSSTAIVSVAVQMSSLVMANSLQDTPIVGEPKVSQSLSPNGDGNNDVLAIDNIEQYPDNNIIIMTAGGAKVYEAAGYGTGGKVFNGHSSVSGKLQTAGTYFYQLEYKADGETKVKRGYFVIKY